MKKSQNAIVLKDFSQLCESGRYKIIEAKKYEAQGNLDKSIELTTKSLLDYKNAEKLLIEKNLIDKYSAHIKDPISQVYFNLGVLHRDKDNIRLSIEFFKKCIELNQNHDEAYLNLAVLSDKMRAEFVNIDVNEEGKFIITENNIQNNINKAYVFSENSIKYYLKIKSPVVCKTIIKDNLKMVYKIHAAINLAMKNIDEQIKCYKEIIKISSEKEDKLILSTLYANKGDMLFIEKSYEESELFFKKALNYKKSDDLIIRSLIRVLIILEKYRDALEYSKKLSEESSENKIIKSLCMYNFDIRSDAIKTVDSIKDKDLYALFLKADYLSAINPENALEFIKEAESLGYNHPNLYHVKSHILLRLGKLEEALEFIEKSLAMGHKTPEALLDKFNILISMQKYEDAEAFYTDTIAKIPPREFTLDKLHELNHNLGGMYYKQSKYEEAEKFFMIASSFSPNNDFTHFHLLKTQIALGKIKSREEIFDFYKGKNLLKPELIQSEEKSHNKIKTKVESDKEPLFWIVFKYSNCKNEHEKHDLNQEFQELIQSNKILKEIFITFFFNKTSPDQNHILDKILTKEPDSWLQIIFSDPNLEDNFYKLSKFYLDSLIDKKDQVEIAISNELEGIHKICTKNLKSNWFFKFSQKILENIQNIGINIVKLKHNINDLSIIPENIQGKIGIKKHEIKISGGDDFSMLKICLQDDIELFSKTLFSSYDPINDKMDYLSIFDSYEDHEGMAKIINGNNNLYGFTKAIISYDEFQEELLG